MTYQEHFRKALKLSNNLAPEAIEEVLKDASNDCNIRVITGGVDKEFVRGRSLMDAWYFVKLIAEAHILKSN